MPEFAGTARNGTAPSAQLRAQLEDFVLAAYADGRSLREIGELIDRSQTAVRRVLDKHQVPPTPSRSVSYRRPAARPIDRPVKHQTR